MIYQPLEDSFLLEKEVKKFAKGSVLDMGTGSGIQAVAAAKRKQAKKVLAVDIQKSVIDFCKKNVKNKKIKFRQSNLFKSIPKQKFDTIIFNPPYLPAEPKLKDLTVEGGKKGFETVQRFLKSAGAYLKDDGIILLLISSLTNKAKVEEILTENLFEFEILSKKHIFFEDLLVYKIQKNKIVQKLIKKGVKNIQYFTKGHRGILFTGKYKNKKITIKAKLPESEAVGRIANEGKWIKKLNKEGIGPNLVMAEKDFFAYHFVEGKVFPKFAEKAGKQKLKKIIRNLFMQCHKLDKLGIDKEEMHRPYKHILVKGNKATLLDFERVHKSKKPKNVTQFIQYLASGKIGLVKRKKAIEVSKAYKKSMDIKPVLDYVGS